MYISRIFEVKKGGVWEAKIIISTSETKQLKIPLVILIAMYTLSFLTSQVFEDDGTKTLERHR